MNCFDTTHVFTHIYIFHMIITINSPFYPLTLFNYTNQIHNFELVHTLDKFIYTLRHSCTIFREKNMPVFLKSKLV